jgi:anaphase-promoting complex subunit 8
VCFKSPPSSWKSSLAPAALEDEGDATYLLGRAYFDAREHLRAHHALRDATASRSRFLGALALFLAGEARRQEDAALLVPAVPLKKEEASSTASSAAAPSTAPSNPFLAEVSAMLEPHQQTCGFSSYLLGVCQRLVGMEDLALSTLARAVSLEPFLWAAWTEIARLLCAERYADSKQGPGVEMRVAALGLGKHWMYKMFLTHLKCELRSYEECLVAADCVLASCPGSVFARTIKALTYYNMREFEAAAALFDVMWKEEPYRIADMDVFSNVREKRGLNGCLKKKNRFCMSEEKRQSCHILRIEFPRLIDIVRKAVALLQIIIQCVERTSKVETWFCCFLPCLISYSS